MYHLTCFAIHWIKISTLGYHSQEHAVLMIAMASLENGTPCSLPSIGNVNRTIASEIGQTIIPATAILVLLGSN